MGKDKITVKEMKHDGLVEAVATTASFMQKYRVIFIALGIILVAGVVVYAAVSYHRTSMIAQAANELAAARSKEDLSGISERYSESPSAPLALIRLAAVLYDEGDYSRARDSYLLFLDRYPRHPLTPFAQMGAAYCLESEGKWEEAIAGYRRVGERYPTSSLAPEAAVNRGRCLRFLGRVQDALLAYQDVIERFPRSLYAGLAREELVDLLSSTVLKDEITSESNDSPPADTETITGGT